MTRFPCICQAFWATSWGSTHSTYTTNQLESLKGWWLPSDSTVECAPQVGSQKVRSMGTGRYTLTFPYSWLIFSMVNDGKCTVGKYYTRQTCWGQFLALKADWRPHFQVTQMHEDVFKVSQVTWGLRLWCLWCAFSAAIGIFIGLKQFVGIWNELHGFN